jgi:hypothetical protein
MVEHLILQMKGCHRGGHQFSFLQGLSLSLDLFRSTEEKARESFWLVEKQRKNKERREGVRCLVNSLLRETGERIHPNLLFCGQGARSKVSSLLEEVELGALESYPEQDPQEAFQLGDDDEGED